MVDKYLKLLEQPSVDGDQDILHTTGKKYINYHNGPLQAI